MLDAREINHAISQLEYEESSYPSYRNLAALYIIRDHMQSKAEPVELEPIYEMPDYSESPAQTMDLYGDSDFLRAVAGKDPGAVWGIIDDLMDTLQVSFPRAYDGIMRKLGNL